MGGDVVRIQKYVQYFDGEIHLGAVAYETEER
jgi:hypothetical protein